jgi:molybdopterin-dependent oxidoreductase alpha subunit
MSRKENPIFPDTLTDLKITDPANFAAGATAIKKSIDHLISEMGAVRAFEAINKMNKVNGFDCPGCAWPDPDGKRSALGEYCENGAKALAEEATLKKVTPDFFETHSLSEMRSWTDYEIGKSGRLTHPMICKEGANHYEKIGWEEAFKLISSQLNELKTPDQAIFYTSGRSSNEAAFLYSLLARKFGTNNLPDCSNMCHESSGVALTETLGIGKGSVTLDDFDKAEVIMILGQNPGTNHPRMLTALQKAKDKGAKIITINPLEEAGLKRFKNPQRIGDFFTGGTNLTDVYVPVKINEDITLLKAIMKALVASQNEVGGVLDLDFINNKTVGYEELVRSLDGFTIDRLLEQAGIEQQIFKEILKLVTPAKNIIICWAMGLTQHKNAVDNIKECVNLLLMKGSIGREGAGTCPVRGHSNVQGDRTMGINHKLSASMATSLAKQYSFNPPEKEGYDVVHSIMAMHEKRASIFMALGGNFLAAASDTNYTTEAITNCKLTVSISTKLNRSHLYPGKTGLILPTLGRSEKDHSDGVKQFVTVENSMGKVQPSSGVLAPISNFLMSEPTIICKLGLALFGANDPIKWQDYSENYDLIRSDISKVIEGFENYNERIEGGKEFYLPNNAREADFSALAGGKAQFSICSLPNHQLKPDEFLLMTIRSHDQFNTTIYGLDDRYRGVFNERRVIFMNKKDMQLMGIEKYDVVDIFSHYNGVERRVKNFRVVPYQIPRTNLGAYFPETNPLIPITEFADKSQTPISKSIKVTIKKSETQ